MGQHARAHQAPTRWALLGLAAVGATGWPSVPASAQEAPPTEAVDFYQSGREHFAAGEYQEAATDLERALMLDPGSVTLLFNLGRVYELMGELNRSISFYQRYFRLLPEEDVSERDRVAQTLRRLEGARDRGPSRPDPEEVSEPAPVRDEQLAERRYESRAGVADMAFWVAAGTAAAALVAGGVAGALALSKQQEAREFVVGADGSTVDRGDRVVDAKNLALTADILLALGAAGAITAALLYGLRSETVDLDSAEGARPVVASDGSGVWVGLRGAF